jgi:hypothetical protein
MYKSSVAAAEKKNRRIFVERKMAMNERLYVTPSVRKHRLFLEGSTLAWLLATYEGHRRLRHERWSTTNTFGLDLREIYHDQTLN